MSTVRSRSNAPQPGDITTMRRVLERETGLQFTDSQATAALRAAVEVALTEQSRLQLADELARIPHPIPPATSRATQAAENAWKAIEAESGLLPGAEVAEVLGSRSAPTAARSFANDMRKRGALLAVRRLNRYLYPGFQFDRERGRVMPWVAPFAGLATEHALSQEDALLWLYRPTTYLPNDARPVDVIASDPDLVIDVARRAWEVEW